MLELDEHARPGAPTAAAGPAYQAERAADRAHAEEAYAVYESQRAELRQRAQRERQWATTGVTKEKKHPRDNDKAQRDFRINRTEKLASRARRTERALESLEAVEKPWEGWDLRFAISEAARSGAVVARLDDAVVERGDFVLGPLHPRHRVGGAHGARRARTGRARRRSSRPCSAGSRWRRGRRHMGPSVVVGELGQDRRVPRGTSSTVADAFVGRHRAHRGAARSQLAKFGLGADAVLRPPSSLSPGERTRAELAAFAATGVNFLVLDEPTNHLDLPAIEQLESALGGYEGTLLLVSHDRRLLETVPVTRRVELPGGADASSAACASGRSVRRPRTWRRTATATSLRRSITPGEPFLVRRAPSGAGQQRGGPGEAGRRNTGGAAMTYRPRVRRADGRAT